MGKIASNGENRCATEHPCLVQHVSAAEGIRLFFIIANRIWWDPDFPVLAVHYSQGFTMSRFTIARGNCISFFLSTVYLPLTLCAKPPDASYSTVPS